MIEVESVADLQHHVGELAGTSDWLLVDQAMIDRFADVTLDHNWYHVDKERATRELPGGTTIAHGLLLLSLIPGLSPQTVRVRHHNRVLNYGFDKVRFTAIVPVNSRVRLRATVKAAEHSPRGVKITRECVMELEGSERPALAADWIAIVTH